MTPGTGPYRRELHVRVRREYGGCDTYVELRDLEAGTSHHVRLKPGQQLLLTIKDGKLTWMASLP